MRIEDTTPKRWDNPEEKYSPELKLAMEEFIRTQWEEAPSLEGRVSQFFP